MPAIIDFFFLLPARFIFFKRTPIVFRKWTRKTKANKIITDMNSHYSTAKQDREADNIKRIILTRWHCQRCFYNGRYVFYFVYLFRITWSNFQRSMLWQQENQITKNLGILIRVCKHEYLSEFFFKSKAVQYSVGV